MGSGSEFDWKEVALIRYTPDQNAALENSFAEFYKLDSSPKISKELFVERESYQTFKKARAKERETLSSYDTPINLTFDPKQVPFMIVSSVTRFQFPSGTEIILDEQLDKPNGLTKEVRYFSSNGKNMKFDVYLVAEAQVVQDYLNEIKGALNGKSN